MASLEMMAIFFQRAGIGCIPKMFGGGCSIPKIGMLSSRRDVSSCTVDGNNAIKHKTIAYRLIFLVGLTHTTFLIQTKILLAPAATLGLWPARGRDLCLNAPFSAHF